MAPVPVATVDQRTAQLSNRQYSQVPARVETDCCPSGKSTLTVLWVKDAKNRVFGMPNALKYSSNTDHSNLAYDFPGALSHSSYQSVFDSV